MGAVADAKLADVQPNPQSVCGEWNYTLVSAAQCRVPVASSRPPPFLGQRRIERAGPEKLCTCTWMIVQIIACAFDAEMAVLYRKGLARSKAYNAARATSLVIRYGSMSFFSSSGIATFSNIAVTHTITRCAAATRVFRSSRNMSKFIVADVRPT